MSREELYMKLDSIEKFCHELKVCEEHKVIPQFVPNDEAYKVGGYAKEILSYIRSNNDFNLAIECCEIERSTLYRLSVEDKEIMSSIALCVCTLRKIHDFALKNIWKISIKDIEECKYYIKSVDGFCRESETQKKIPIPTEVSIDNELLSKIDKNRAGFDSPEPQPLSEALNTDKAKKYFPRAVEAGYMELTETGYKWLFGGAKGGKARLAYFLHKVYNPDGCSQIPYKRLNALFGVVRLDVAIDQMLYAKRAQKWRPQIDILFND